MLLCDEMVLIAKILEVLFQLPSKDSGACPDFRASSQGDEQYVR